tara:strand:+ start:1748 stop:1972 length:225 start_codon:yes stop_codon:yes gene_type:complete
MTISKTILFFGFFVIILSFITYLFEISGLQIFKLPGDIYIKNKNWTFYMPITSMVLISFVLTLLYKLGIGNLMK